MARDRAREYKPSTIKRLTTLSGNQCAKPGCIRPVLAHDRVTFIGKICHIEGASEGGPRFNKDMSDDERRHFDNLILLCDECHSVIDNIENESDFPVELLQRWKKQHEDTATYSLLGKKPTYLNEVINAISDLNLEDPDPSDSPQQPFDVEDKIRHNSVKRNRPLIEECRVFYHRVNSLYQQLEKDGIIKKTSILRNIRLVYLKVKGRYMEDSKDTLQTVQNHADDIFEDTIEELLSLTERAGFAEEDAVFGVSLIAVDAFIRCKILENPGAP